MSRTYLAHHGLESNININININIISIIITIIIIITTVIIVIVTVIIITIHITCDITIESLSVRAQKAKEPHGPITEAAQTMCLACEKHEMRPPMAYGVFHASGSLGFSPYAELFNAALASA